MSSFQVVQQTTRDLLQSADKRSKYCNAAKVFASPINKQDSAKSDECIEMAENMLASISSFAKQSNFEVLICLRDTSSKKIAQLSSDCKRFTLGSAVDALSTCKSTIASLTS